MNEERKKVLIIGVIGADVHAVGNKILYHAFTEAGFDVVNLGVMVSQEEYIEAAIEADADYDVTVSDEQMNAERKTLSGRALKSLVVQADRPRSSLLIEYKKHGT